MPDHYLKFPDEALWDAIRPAFAVPPPGVDRPDWRPAIYVVGTIRVETGATVEIETPDGPMVMPVFEAIPGWHVNVRAQALPPAAQPFAIDPPATPAMVFAGEAG